MNHLIISREYPPAPAGGGIGTYARHMAELLAGHGETVHVIGQRWPGAARPLETRLGGRLLVHRVAVEDARPDPATRAVGDPAILETLRDPSVNAGFMWQAGQLAESLIETAGIDIVEAQEYEAPTATMMFRRLAGLGPARRVPQLIHLHTPTEFVLTANRWASDLPTFAPAIQLESAVIRAADAWLSPSRFLAAIAESHYALPEGGVQVIPYPLGDTDRLDRDERTWRDGTICYAGRLEPRKGVIEWIEAAVAVAPDLPARFTLIGRDTSPASLPGASVRAELLTRIPQGLRPRFRFIEAVARRALLAHLAEARIAVVPSRWENFPNACIEAMASGVPVLVSPHGGMAEMVDDGRTGWIASGSDAVSLERALRRALGTPALELAEMGAAAAMSIRRLCDNGSVVEQQLKFRRQVVASGCRPSSVLRPAFQIAASARASSDHRGPDPRVIQGQTMGVMDLLHASPAQQRAVVRRALANPGYVVRWLTWHSRRWFTRVRGSRR